MAQAEREQLSVVMFPWLAHGHITPYLELARRLTSSDRRSAAGDTNIDVTVHLVSTPVNLSAIARHQTSRIRFVELHLPAAPPDLPPALHTTKHLPSRLMPALKRACDLAAPRLGALLDELRPDLLLFDFLYPWAPLEAAARGVPAVHLSTCSAAATSFFVHCLGGAGAGNARAFPFQGVGLGTAEEEAKYTSLFAVREHPDALVPERDRLLLSLARSSGFVAVKTCADIERPYMGYLSELLDGKEIVPVGPLLVDDSDAGAGAGSTSAESDRVTRWLDAQPPASVVLVSVGSEYFMSEQQLAQMARGLELSGERFLWVVRFPKAKGSEDDGDDNAARALPSGFAPAAPEGRGLVVEGWAPQRRVLAHRACGAFLSHCGWSSVLESLAAGVPVVALPLHIDQPLGANLAAELGAAVRVPQERFGEFRAEDVARAVRAAMRGEESAALRRRAAELREAVARNDDADGKLVDALVQRMARLCGKGQPRVAVPN